MDESARLSAGDETRWTHYFWILASAHVVVWTIVSFATQPNATLDTVEMIFWGRAWEWGYYKHPPLPAWIAAAANDLDEGTFWLVYPIAQLASATCLWAAWRLAYEMVSPKLAFFSAALLECSFYYTLTNTEINNNVIVRPFWALAALFLYWAIRSGRLRWWIASGLSLGLAMLSKYDAAILAVAMLGFSAFHPTARTTWRTAGPYCLLAASLSVFAMHAAWVLENDFLTIGYALGRSEGVGRWSDRFVYPVQFLLSQAWALLPMLIVGIPVFGWRWRLRESNRVAPFDRAFIAWMVFVPPAIIVALSLLFGVRIRSMWGSALWTYAGLAMVLMLDIRPDRWAWRRAALHWSAVVSVLIAACVLRNVAAPHLKNKPSRIHFPGDRLAQKVVEAWQSKYEGEVPIVAGPWWTAGNAAVYGSDDIETYGNLSRVVSPWASDEELRARGGVVVWQEGAESLPDDFLSRFPDARPLPTVELPWKTSAKLPPLRVGMFLIPPNPPNRDAPLSTVERPTTDEAW